MTKKRAASILSNTKHFEKIEGVAGVESRFSRQMKKGVLEMLVLGLVCEQPGHGYELLGRLAARSSGFLRTKEGTLYPLSLIHI